ncbi:hypothetical protein DPMN_028194 [Dreissena polymorpha]|uniref:Uncharacterized protein n=1 Tax=Dreissena polymorpha TaxID=45954 RepID=A0A9D4RG89_DREPO|nr:hypothetical protein DPMN_028194 [Dreissena polymorpha]
MRRPGKGTLKNYSRPWRLVRRISTSVAMVFPIATWRKSSWRSQRLPSKMMRTRDLNR